MINNDPLADMYVLASQLKEQAAQVEALADRLDRMLYPKGPDLDLVATVLRTQSESVERVARDLDVLLARATKEAA